MSFAFVLVLSWIRDLKGIIKLIKCSQDRQQRIQYMTFCCVFYKQRILTRFVKLQGSTLSEVKRIIEEIWFQEGWSEFAEAHSISEGQIIFFEYKGNSSIHWMKSLYQCNRRWGYLRLQTNVFLVLKVGEMINMLIMVVIQSTTLRRDDEFWEEYKPHLTKPKTWIAQ